MAVKKLYVGSFGPFLYDDTDLVGDPEGHWPGETQVAVRTDGQMVVGEVPTLDDEVVRLVDLSLSVEESKRYALLLSRT